MFELSLFLRDRLIGRQAFTIDEVRIGRSADNEVQIDNAALSRYHASIEAVAGLHLVKDFGSTNGTYVNGERVAGRAALSDGDRITVGKFTIVFRTPQRARIGAPEVADHASYAAAGKTLVMKTVPTERPCPWVGYLEEKGAAAAPPPRHVVDRDLFLVGATPTAQLVVGGKVERQALVVRSWGGFSLVALAPGVRRNQKDVELSATLSDGDLLSFGGAVYSFHAGQPNG